MGIERKGRQKMVGIDLPEDVHERLTILKARLRAKTLYRALDTAVSKLLEEMDAAQKREKEEGR